MKQPTLKVAPEHERAWAAGFFDGEGNTCFVSQGRNRKLVVQVAQTDRRTLDRFRAAVGDLGTVYGPYDRKEANHSPVWRFDARSSVYSQQILALLWDYLSEVKREQATRAIQSWREYYEANPNMARGVDGRKVRCPQGHQYTPENTYTHPKTGCNQCRICRRVAQRKYLERVSH